MLIHPSPLSPDKADLALDAYDHVPRATTHSESKETESVRPISLSNGASIQWEAGLEASGRPVGYSNNCGEKPRVF